MFLSDEKTAIIGVGYVALPLSVEFGKKYEAVGYSSSVGEKLDLFCM